MVCTMRCVALVIAVSACLAADGFAQSATAHRALEADKPVVPPIVIAPVIVESNNTQPETPAPTTKPAETEAPKPTTRPPATEPSSATTPAPTTKAPRGDRDTTTTTSDIESGSVSGLETDAVVRRSDGKLNLGTMAGITAAVLLCIGLAFAFVYRRKKNRKASKKKPDIPVMNSTASTTASTTYCEIARGSKGSRSSAASSGSRGSGGKQSAGKQAIRSNGSGAVSTVPSHPQPSNKPPRPPQQAARNQQPQQAGSAFYSTSNFVSTEPSQHSNGLTTVRLNDSPSTHQADPMDSSRSIAGVMKSYRNQPPGMFEDNSVRKSSLHTRRNMEFEFTLDTADRPAAIDPSQLEDAPSTRVPRTGYVSPITEAPMLVRDSSKSVDEDDLHDPKV